jgi:hypothetical protein
VTYDVDIHPIERNIPEADYDDFVVEGGLGASYGRRIGV